jgi:ATP-binding cassette, subfamily B, multidrug efflux pump
MGSLKALNRYFWKYKWLFLAGVLFIVLSNYFRILSPQVTKYVLNTVEQTLAESPLSTAAPANYDPLVRNLVVEQFDFNNFSFRQKVLYCGIILLVLAFIGGFFMFLMRQTIIVMSRKIEFDQKNQIFSHYQDLDTNFYKTHSTGDLMSRMAEDVSRVRMYTGPAVMYLINLAATIGFSVFYMLKENVELTIYVLAPLPILAITIYLVNTVINKKSDKIQSLLSDLTTNAQESYSGIRVIKSFVQEKAMFGFFKDNSESYRKNAISLSKIEAIYFPSMSLLIGLSTILTIMIGGIYVIRGEINIGVIGEFVMYILMLTFPVSAIGWTASMIQRAAASQARLNEFLDTKPAIVPPEVPVKLKISGRVKLDNVSFTYPHTGIKAIKNFSLEIEPGQKIAIIGKTGSGKSTLAQLLLRMYDPQSGDIYYDGVSIRHLDPDDLRSQVSYVPQDVFLFSDTVAANIGFGIKDASLAKVRQAASQASIAEEIEQFPAGYDTMIGERGVTLSGGQKQRISIARALAKDPNLVIFDDCLSAVDSKTEKRIIGSLYEFLQGRTAIIITHRIFSLFDFDKIIVLNDGEIAEQGTHLELLALRGHYSEMYAHQQDTDA